MQTRCVARRNVDWCGGVHGSLCGRVVTCCWVLQQEWPQRCKQLTPAGKPAHAHVTRPLCCSQSVLVRLADTKAVHEVRVLAAFFDMLRTDPDRAFYGLKVSAGRARRRSLLRDLQARQDDRRVVAAFDSSRTLVATTAARQAVQAPLPRTSPA